MSRGTTVAGIFKAIMKFCVRKISAAAILAVTAAHILAQNISSLPPGSRADNVPPAPTGTIFVIGPEGGYAVPPCRFTLLFGRNREDVHVPLGADDPAISRYHGEFSCAGPGAGWWLKNTGDLPIELPDGALLLTGQTRAVEPGYTPRMINRTEQRPHLLEVRLVTAADSRPRSASG